MRRAIVLQMNWLVHILNGLREDGPKICEAFQLLS